jgi:hypothetical protein
MIIEQVCGPSIHVRIHTTDGSYVHVCTIKYHTNTRTYSHKHTHTYIQLHTDEDLNRIASAKLSGFPHALIAKDFTKCALNAELQGIKDARTQCTRLVLAMFLLPDALNKLASELLECMSLCDVVATMRWPLPEEYPGFGHPENNGREDGYWLYKYREIS